MTKKKPKTMEYLLQQGMEVIEGEIKKIKVLAKVSGLMDPIDAKALATYLKLIIVLKKELRMEAKDEDPIEEMDDREFKKLAKSSLKFLKIKEKEKKVKAPVETE